MSSYAVIIQHTEFYFYGDDVPYMDDYVTAEMIKANLTQDRHLQLVEKNYYFFTSRAITSREEDVSDLPCQ